MPKIKRRIITEYVQRISKMTQPLSEYYKSSPENRTKEEPGSSHQSIHIAVLTKIIEVYYIMIYLLIERIANS